MKKVLYSIMMVALVLTGCTKWDDAKSEVYPDGPSININVTATADSAFTFVLTPGEGTTYYSYVVDQADEADALDGATLLKGGYTSVSQAVLNTESDASFTYNMRKADNTPLCLPNTTYQIYAVASNDKGMVGEVAVVTVTTSDAGAPTITNYKADAATKSATVMFNQNVYQGEGKISGVYYKEFEFENPVALTAEDITITIEGGNVTLAAPKAPAGAHILFSYEEGAFVDEAGNKCGAVNSMIDETAETVEDMFVGIYVHAANETWKISDDIVAPSTGYSIGPWEEFLGTITFAEKVYVIPEDLASGDLSVTYAGEERTITQNLKVTDWKVADNVLTFKLPIEPQVGDMITLNVKEGVLYDVYGNSNEAYTTENLSWKYVGFIPTKENVLGTFDFTYTSYFDGKDYAGPAVTIVEDTENTEVENAIIIKNLYMEGSAVSGYYDLENFTVYVETFNTLGFDDVKNAKLVTVNSDDTQADYIEYTINPDGTLTSNYFGVYGFDKDSGSPMGWWEVAMPSTFTPAPAATSRAMSAKGAVKRMQKKAVKKPSKGSRIRK